MSEGRITRLTLADVPRGPHDWSRADALTDEEIEAAVRDDPDAVPIMDSEEWFKDAVIVEPLRKRPISIRIDEDVLDWFRENNQHYQTKINAVLRSYMEHQRKTRA